MDLTDSRWVLGWFTGKGSRMIGRLA